MLVYAAGGLGNQLFQLAAGHSIRSGREVICEVGFSGPRKDLHSSNVLNSLTARGVFSLKSSSKFRFITQTLLDYLLRVSTKTTGPESLRIYRALLSLIGSTYFSVYYGSFLVLSLSRGVGHYTIPTHKTNQMIVGYFQSYKYLRGNEELSFFNTLNPREPGPDWLGWSQRALVDKPVIVHIRLGDYLSEKNFGIVTTGYIAESLQKLDTLLGSCPIWVFSDQGNLASDIFPPKFLNRVVWVPEIDSDPLATMSIMRLGIGYIIANSSFSWWAARSKQVIESPVYCPCPWFSGSETPKDLLPTNWIQVDINFEDHK